MKSDFMGPKIIEFPDNMAISMELIRTTFDHQSFEIAEFTKNINNKYTILYSPILVGKDKNSLSINLNFGKTRQDREHCTDLYKISIQKVKVKINE